MLTKDDFKRIDFSPYFSSVHSGGGNKRTGERTLGGRGREMGKWRKRYWTRSRYPLKQNSGINKKKKERLCTANCTSAPRTLIYAGAQVFCDYCYLIGEGG